MGGKKGRKKRGVLQAVLLNNALNQRNPIRITTTPAPRPAPAGPVCYNVPTTTCKNIPFDVPNVSCRHMPWKVCENRPNTECHSTRVINRGVGHRKVCS